MRQAESLLGKPYLLTSFVSAYTHVSGGPV
jgi:hypothetical protein